MKRFLISLLCPALILNLTGCYDAKHIERTVAVLAVGIDKAEKGQKISFHLDLPSSTGEEEPLSNSEPKVLTVNAPTVLAALQKVNDITSTNIDLSHVKMLVFSENVAKDGIRDILDELMRSYRFQNNAYTVVSKGEAENVLKNIKPEEETYTSVYYQTILQKQYKSTRKDFLAYQVYFNVTDDVSHAFTLPLIAESNNGEKEKFSGSAVFCGDKMIGTLSEKEELANSILCGVMQRRSFSAADADNENKTAVLLLTQNDKPQILTKEMDGKIYVNIKISLIGLYQVRQNDENDNAFKDSVEKEIEEMCIVFLRRTSEDFGIDLLDVKNKLKRKFLTDKEWDRFNKEAHPIEYKIEAQVRLPQANSFKDV